VREEKKPERRKKPIQDLQNFACIGHNFTKVKEEKNLLPSNLHAYKMLKFMKPSCL
jgi:hypothetical protein